MRLKGAEIQHRILASLAGCRPKVAFLIVRYKQNLAALLAKSPAEAAQCVKSNSAYTVVSIFFAAFY